MRIKQLLIVAMVAAASAAMAENIDFAAKRMLAGKAKIAETGYVVSRSLGRANLSPELAFPVELVYDSDNEKTGMFGFAWSSPQLESSAVWNKDGMLWTSPWGERMKFFPKSEKTPDDAIKLEVVEEAKKGRGYYSPYSDWEADVASGDAGRGNWVVRGRKGKAGWSFVYTGSRLVKITSPAGTSAEFVYGDAGLKSVSQLGVDFVTVAYTGKVATSVTVNGVETRLAYAENRLEILPRTKDGHAVHPTLPQLVSIRRGSLAPESYSYDGNYLAGTKCGGVSDAIAFKRDGRAVRIVSDMNFKYAYADDGRVTLENREGRAASYAYDEKNGVFRVSEFSGKKYEIFYFLRYDVAYLGKVRKIVDGKGDDLVGYRYDAKSGNVTRVRDRFGNDRNFEYDSLGRLAKTSRRASGSRSVEPVASFAYGNGREAVAVSLLDEKGVPAVTTKISRDAAGRPVAIDDGRGKREVSYNRFGYPTEIRDVFGNTTKICYNTFNVPVKTIDANGIVTEYEYNADGLVTSVTRKDGAETLASVSVAYDKNGLPVSYVDQDGLTTSFDRDAFGRVLKEKFADGSEVAYTYDAFGRRTSVLDENGHKIAFDWNRFGLSSRTTAENQLTDYVRDDDGLVTEILSKQNGRTDRAIRNEYDEYGRLVYVDYGKGETEKFTYDKWGRVASHSRGDLKTTYAYDHFGRVVKKDETSVSSSPSSFTFTSYTYDRYGSRTSRVTRNRKGEIVSKETRGYDRYGRLAETAAFGSSVKYAYDAKGHLTSQTINGELIEYVYTRRGQLAGKYLGGKLKPDAAVEYEYSKDGQITARTANGVRQTYEYDFKGQLLGVREGEEYVERYAYDKAGNMTKKTVGGKTTTFTFDDANQLVSSTTDGITTRYEYDAAGRLVREGNKTYTYGYLDKVMSVRDGANKFTYTYHPDGQLATADYGNSGRARTLAAPQGEDSPSFETFTWDGLALIQRDDEHFINEPHVGGGNPVVSSKGTSYFNDMLGTTVGAKSGKTYSAATLSAFGEDLNHHSLTSTSHFNSFFTGKPHVAGLGHAFLMRNYRASLSKWQTADPLGYPDGWNQLAYCGNGVTSAVDLWGCAKVTATVKQTETPLLSGDIGTSDYIYTINLNCALHSIEFVFTELFYVDPNMKHSCDYDSGDGAIYIEHNGSPRDSSLTPVYEAVLAHEMGHANCRVECIKGYLQTSLVKLEIEWLLHADWTEADVKNKIFAQVEIAKANSITRTINAANQPTVSWFQSSSDWIFVDSGITKVNGKETTYWKWRKE